jgi:hypothetical protein
MFKKSTGTTFQSRNCSKVLKLSCAASLETAPSRNLVSRKSEECNFFILVPFFCSVIVNQEAVASFVEYGYC